MPESTIPCPITQHTWDDKTLTCKRKEGHEGPHYDGYLVWTTAGSMIFAAEASIEDKFKYEGESSSYN